MTGIVIALALVAIAIGAMYFTRYSVQDEVDEPEDEIDQIERRTW